MTRKCINADGAVAVGPYSHAVEAGEFLFLSGQTPIDPQTQKLSEGNIVEQTKQCFEIFLKYWKHQV
nr:Rid family hydrolase [Priestia aryabhattai]